MSHLLVTNDFPPKVGGIQTYLWELWRRLPPASFSVLTTPYRGDREFDAAQPFRISRTGSRVMLPTPALGGRVRSELTRSGARLAVIDPVLPLGLLGPRLTGGHRYAVVLHGAEVSVPGRLPVGRQALAAVLRHAVHVIAAGQYPLAEAERVAGESLPATVIPPGVDTDRFRPIDAGERRRVRLEAGLPAAGRLVLGVSRLVPRKGMDVFIAAASLLAEDRPDVTFAIAGGGSDLPRLRRLASATRAPVRFLGRVADERLPGLVASADIFVMLCRSRWGGLEQEGFGVVFLEAAACGVPQVVGESGGSAEAVNDGSTGILVRRPDDPAHAAAAIARLLDDPELRAKQGEAARHRAVDQFRYDVLAGRLRATLEAVE